MVKVSVDSVAVMRRTPTVTEPYSTALQSANSEPSWNVSAPGPATSRTPTKPMPSASHRAGPTVSLNSRAATTVANSGAEKLMAVALASGIRLKAIRMKVCEAHCETLRTTWEPSFSVWNTARPVDGRMKAATHTRPTAQRLNRTSPTG